MVYSTAAEFGYNTDTSEATEREPKYIMLLRTKQAPARGRQLMKLNSTPYAKPYASKLPTATLEIMGCASNIDSFFPRYIRSILKSRAAWRQARRARML